MFNRNQKYQFLGILEPIARLVNRKKLRVLAYHKVGNIAAFEKHILHLRKFYNIIDIHTLNSVIEQGGGLKDNSVLITFDDGDRSFYENAFPILNKYKVPATLFVITGLLNSSIPFWWEELEYILGEEEGHKKAWEVKGWKNEERLSYFSIIRKTSTKPQLKTFQLNTKELIEMNLGGISIANHSHTHPMFDRCQVNTLKEELDKSSNYLKTNKLDYQYFAYPNGNWDLRSEMVLKEYNINLAFLFDHKLSDLKNPLRISRIRVDADLDLSEFMSKISGLHSLLYHKAI